MKLEVAVGERALREGDDLVVSPRAPLELQLDGAGADAPPAAQLELVLTLARRRLRADEFEVVTADRRSTPPELAFRTVLRCWPLRDSVWATQSLQIELRNADGAGLASRQLRLIPTPQARAAQVCLLASVALSLLIAWPAFHVRPANFSERAFLAVFGAPLIVLVLSAVLARLKQL
ncbi:MAG TPA: hypothetical protein VG963_31045, partial [Polyangiaceae bacterium]|nr:hypothetical protein [Polyangiaceae bacterium]